MTPKLDMKSHWEEIYNTKPPREVSWYQTRPSISLKLIEATGIEKGQGIIDVGGGSSMLVDCLLDEGNEDLAVLDISGQSLMIARSRLGDRKDDVEWYESDATEFQPPRQFHLWHDRAVFHFLTDERDRRKYVNVLKETLMPEGHLVMATFAIDGPKRCSGLDTVQYDEESMSLELGDEFVLMEKVDEAHVTPGGKVQKFTYFLYQRKPLHTQIGELNG
ncbi:MAG: class I SAM-dependent methyltransferase [Candidatus Bathyarchaeota archaeon]|nr:class I SAM-dependent methyltransferase [Candidatus Bathyarchaeota archaeon]